MRNRVAVSFVVAVVAFAVLVGLLGPVVEAAPLAVPTPVSVTKPAATQPWRSFTIWNAATFTADTDSTCYEIADFSVADIQYVIDQGTTNTTTITLRWSNDGTTLTNGVNLVASNAADASDMQQVALFGRYMCLLADVTNSNTITITAKVLVK